MLFQPDSYTWPPVPQGMVICHRCREYYHPDDYKQCPACYAPCESCSDWMAIEDLQAGRCAVCIDEEKS